MATTAPFVADLTRVTSVLATLLSPLDFESTESWQGASLEAVQALFKPDKALFVADLHQGESPSVVCRDCPPEMTQSYQHYYAEDPSPARIQELGLLRVSTMRLLGGDRSPEFHRTAIWNEWFVPNRLRDSIQLTLVKPGQPVEAGIVMYYDRPDSPQCDSPAVAVMELLWPAFHAGVRMTQRFDHLRADWLGSLDVHCHAVRVIDRRGRVLHQTPALTTLLAKEPERLKIEREIDRVAGSLGVFCKQGVADPKTRDTTRRAHTAAANYTMRGSLARAVPSGPWLLVSVERRESAAAADLKEHYGLTSREVDVARLLAKGLTNKALAHALGISTHTALRHTERVLSKLAVHSRAGVAGVLFNGGA